MIQNPKQLKALCTILQQEPMIALDTEFIREKTYYPQIALIQVATPKEIFLIDPLALSPQQLESFLNILQNKKILKIFHAAQADQECFLVAYKCLATPIFDTAEAATLCGFRDSPGLSYLLKEALNIQIKKGSSRTNWHQRPLPEELIQYAEADVAHLIPLTNALMSLLKKNGRLDWAMDLSQQWEEEERFLPDPVKMANNIALSGRLNDRTYNTLIDLMKWREDRVMTLDIPRRRLADNATLIGLAKACPTSTDHLKSFRGLNIGGPKEVEALLNILQKAAKTPKDKLIPLPRKKLLSPAQKRVVEFLRFSLEALSSELSITPQKLLPTEVLTKIVLHSQEYQSPEDLLKSKLINPQVFHLIGQTLWKLLQSRKGLIFHQGQLKLVDLSPNK